MTSELQRWGLQRLRNLPKSAQLAGGRAQTQTRAGKLLDQPGSTLPARSKQAPWSPKPGSRWGSVLTGGLGWQVHCAGQPEPSRGIPATQTVSNRV